MNIKIREQNYNWPALPGRTELPIWVGEGFEVGSEKLPLLAYETGSSGWSDGLTSFHEEHAESDHFIDRASRQHAIEQLLRHVVTPNPAILEVGCSSGFMLQVIREQFPQALVIGSDYVRGPLEALTAKIPDLPILQFNLLKCPLPTASLDAVVALNVLEHIEDDAQALSQLHRILKPGGVAVLEVPAGPKLYDVYDELLLHYRRYSRRGLAQIVKAAGFEIVEQSHLGVFMYPGFWLVKQRNKRFLSREKALQQQVVASNIRSTKNKLPLEVAMKLEMAIGQKIQYPFGIRCLMTCRKV